MKPRLCTYGVAILAYVVLLPLPVTLAQVLGSQPSPDCQDPPHWSQDRLSKFNVAIASLEQDVAERRAHTKQTIYWSNQLSEFEAAMASLEQDVATRKADTATKGEAVLNELRASRDAYRVKLTQAATNMTTGAQAADARQSPDEAANAFWAKVNAYLDAVNADIATRQAAMQTKFMGD